MRCDVTRRNILGGVAMCMLLLQVPSAVWGQQAVTVPESAPPALTALIQTIFPHDWLSSEFYDRISQAYWEEVRRQPDMAASLQRGLAQLNGSGIAAFHSLPKVMRTALVQKYDQEPFMKAVLWRVSELIYRNPQVWQAIGYQGSSLEYGGYIERGFDDIDWLPMSGEGRS